jgi:hypothetical protein
VLHAGVQFMEHAGYWLLLQFALLRTHPQAFCMMTTLVKEPLRFAQP